MRQYIQKAFELERKRDLLARTSQLKAFKETYKMGVPEIPDHNTGEMWDELNESPINKRSYPMAFDRVATVISLIKGRNLKILDAGFGQGAVEEKLSPLGICSELIGLDISGESVTRLSKQFKRWKFVRGNILTTRFPKDHFDYILALELLEHISPHNTLKVLRNFFGSLKSKQFLIVSVPVNEGLEVMVNKGENPNAHVRTYTLPVLKAELAVSGFKVILDKSLYAFNSLYEIKSIIARYTGVRKPNVILALAQKP